MLTPRGLLMQTVYLDPISMHEAEDLLAELWLRLEQYGLRTPGIGLESRSDGMVILMLSFWSLEAAGLALGWIKFRTGETPLAVKLQQ